MHRLLELCQSQFSFPARKLPPLKTFQSIHHNRDQRLAAYAVDVCLFQRAVLKLDDRPWLTLGTCHSRRCQLDFAKVLLDGEEAVLRLRKAIYNVRVEVGT